MKNGLCPYQGTSKRDDPNLFWDPQHGERVFLTISEMRDRFDDWIADSRIHHVIAEKPLYHLDHINGEYSLVARIYLKTHANSNATLSSFDSLIEKVDGSNWDCKDNISCLESFVGSNWCITLNIGERLTEGNWISWASSAQPEWEYRFGVDYADGPHVNSLIEKGVSWVTSDGSDPDPFYQLDMCHRENVKETVGRVYMQTVLQAKPPSVSIGLHNSYGFERRGSEAFFDLQWPDRCRSLSISLLKRKIGI